MGVAIFERFQEVFSGILDEGFTGAVALNGLSAAFDEGLITLNAARKVCNCF